MTYRQRLPPENSGWRVCPLSELCPFSMIYNIIKQKEFDMKFPECTVVSINLPNELLEIIDTHATKRILNRSACVRELVTEALKDIDDPTTSPGSLPRCLPTDLTATESERDETSCR